MEEYMGLLVTELKPPRVCECESESESAKNDTRLQIIKIVPTNPSRRLPLPKSMRAWKAGMYDLSVALGKMPSDDVLWINVPSPSLTLHLKDGTAAILKNINGSPPQEALAGTFEKIDESTYLFKNDEYQLTVHTR